MVIFGGGLRGSKEGSTVRELRVGPTSKRTPTEPQKWLWGAERGAGGSGSTPGALGPKRKAGRACKEEAGGRAPRIALPVGLGSSRAPLAGDTSRGHIPGPRWGPQAVPLPRGATFGAAAEKPRGRLRAPLAAPGNCSVLPAAAISAARRPAPPHPRPKMSPGLEESLRRVFEEKLQLRTVPAWDSASLLPSSTRLLLKRREVAEVERALQAQREEFRRRTERLDQRWQELGQREEQLRDVALKFDAFLKVSAVRRERALGRVGEERARAARRGAEANGLRQELAGLLRRREWLRRRLQSLQVFGDYLRGVVATTGQFQDVPSMLAHFGALAGVRAALLHQLEAGQQRLAQGRARLQRYREEAGGELLRGRDEVLQLRARLEAARHDVLQGESCWTQIQSAATHKTLLLGQIRMAVLSLFQLATKHLKVPKDVALEDTESQLDVVLLCMQDLAAICAELHPKEPGLGPPRVAATTTTHPRRHRGVAVPPSHQESQPGGKSSLG
ncbi:cilia- and flagella-associated protein 73 [Oxyura jamaicensis]|uniref:cilia- and flagella-associated protein 73 n=1 Tax=Oxyura jamaicensis TaxID=8884 RepID=UPI0015A51BDD|nr:cilia- and flagella-associated protein 73 [Oxyura jamaicensis]